MKKKKPRFLLLPTYLALIRSSVGSRMFRHCYFAISGKNVEVLENGNLACAFYVTTILKMFDRVHEIHTTVNSTEQDLIASGWKDIARPKLGCVILYAPKIFASGRSHRHLGFYVGKGQVIGNDGDRGMPAIRKWDYRPVERLLWHQSLAK